MSAGQNRRTCDELGVCQDRPIACRGCKPSEGTQTARLLLDTFPLADRPPVTHSTKRLVVSPGDRFGRLTVVSEAPSQRKASGAPARVMNCRCDCGMEKAIRLASLREGTTVSCGCFHAEQAQALLPTASVTHGLSGTPVYMVWQAMIRRCHTPTDKSYPRYGARGIQVCQEWRESFTAFAEHMGPRPDGLTLDRIDSRGNYEPGNVRWATYTQQARNTRRNRHHTIDGVTRCMAEWCELLGVPWTTARKRLVAGRNPFPAQSGAPA